MSRSLVSGALGSAILVASVLSSSAASAHINMEGALQGRTKNELNAQKVGPCEGRPRKDGPVYTFEPGATITLGVFEQVFHDGYFRIAFDDDGEDGFKDPASIDPYNKERYAGNPNRAPGKPCLKEGFGDNCGKSDFCNVVSKTGGPTVLWDNLDPHTGPTAIGTLKYSWNITLPNVECDNCTLQVMQVMEDPAGDAHGPFDGDKDLYYRCVNIVLKKGAGQKTGTTTAPVNNKGIDCLAQTGSGDAGVADAGVDGGVTKPADAGTKADAGVKQDAGVKLDAGTKVDAGTSDDDEDADEEPVFEEDEEEDNDGDEEQGSTRKDAGTKRDAGSKGSTTRTTSGCSLASNTGSSLESASWMLLALGGLVARRRRYGK